MLLAYKQTCVFSLFPPAPDDKVLVVEKRKLLSLRGGTQPSSAANAPRCRTARCPLILRTYPCMYSWFDVCMHV